MALQEEKLVMEKTVMEASVAGWLFGRKSGCYGL